MSAQEAIVRLALVQELATLPGIERAAATRFPQGELPKAALEPMDLQALRQALQEGLLWVVQPASDMAPAGFLAALEIRHCLHIQEMSVLPTAWGQGQGSRLLAEAERAARARNLHFLSLTTFAHLPWNGPWYERRGFVAIPQSEEFDHLFAHLRQQLTLEQALGFRQRIAMVKALD